MFVVDVEGAVAGHEVGAGVGADEGVVVADEAGAASVDGAVAVINGR